MYVLPAIDLLDGKVVRLAKGDYSQVSEYHGDPAAQAHIFEEAGATWLHVVDLNAAKSGNLENIGIIEKIAEETSLKIEVGGGIRSKDCIEQVRNVGVSRCVLGTALVRDPAFARSAVREYGDFLAAGIDAKCGEAAVSGWTQRSGMKAQDLAKQMSDMGYRHLIYTDIARDGMQTGIDVTEYLEMSAAFENPVIVSGGVASLIDIQALIPVAERIEGVIIGRALYEGAIDLASAIDLATEAAC